jgi:hypothetical protein
MVCSKMFKKTIMSNRKNNYKGIIFVCFLFISFYSSAQYQNKNYLKEYANDFKEFNSVLLRDAYPVIGNNSMNEYKIFSRDGSLEKVSSEEYKNIIEIKTFNEFNNDWDLEINAKNVQPIMEGDVVLLTFYMRTVSSIASSKLGFTRVYFQEPSPPWEKVLNENITADSEWRKYQLTFTSPRDFKIGEGGLYFALGYSKQTIQLADITLTNLGTNVKQLDIPTQRFVPGQQEPIAVGVPIPVSYSINTNKDRRPISPYIYGTNGQSEDADENITARRLGGNRMTSYNWENNASNAGHDYMQNNDNYMLWKYKLLSYENTPGITMTAFHDTSVAMKTYTLMTAQMAGFVAADKLGPVDSSEKAPSSRWIEVKPVKGGALSNYPNTSDNYTYMDEMVNFMIRKYGKSDSPNGIKGWALDNEPGLWNSSHSLLHPKQPTCSELLYKSKQLASAIKNLDSNVEIYGPMFWGYLDIYNFTHAPDWKNYQNQYPDFLALYLDKMKAASDSAGKRLLDVVAVHWYPEARGLNDRSVKERVIKFGVAGEGSPDKGVAIARMQAVRSLWDTTYVEDSWYTNDLLHRPIKLIPDMQKNIDRYYPGTKMAMTEYNFGGTNHISGGIAMVDVLGVYAKYNFYFASFWSPVTEYISGAMKLYRNYDGKKSTFGNMYVSSTSSDLINSSIYSSIIQEDDSELHVIVVNKNYDNPINATVEIKSNSNYSNAKIYAIDKSSYEVKLMGSATVTNNNLIYTLPALCAAHIVLTK